MKDMKSYPSKMKSYYKNSYYWHWRLVMMTNKMLLVAKILVSWHDLVFPCVLSPCTCHSDVSEFDAIK
ncbi:hypothetical protein Lalb_Chr05g0217231 [Lupinus albus]|uniref:Uncharacterized protein n=1 Tax=Lupinus albus TaxID=3870 RepID=A0A6A4QJ29_LUPAL|nr:hypothetical protein Lalb_Chr05g0217231 [Lupinus albus]